jgi:predicted Zn-dependent protease with MMP-like domain
MDTRQIIMSYTVAAQHVDDLQALAHSTFEDLPEELVGFCEGKLQVLSLRRSWTKRRRSSLILRIRTIFWRFISNGKEISPGVERKERGRPRICLVLYRRAVLDMWCDAGEDLTRS